MNIFLKNRNYRQFSIASFLSNIGDILFYLAFMTYASKVKNYSLALSLIAISESVPKLFTIFGGYFADRTKHKFRNIFLMAIIRAILYTIVGFLFISQVSEWTLVFAIVIINFFSDTFGSYSSGLVSPLIVDLVGEESFGEAEGFTNGINQVINTAAQFIGAGLLLFMSYSNLAFLNAFTFLAAGLLYATVGLRNKTDLPAARQKEINQQKFWPTMKSSFTQVKKQSGLLSVVLVVAILNGSLSSMGSLIPIMIAGHKQAMVISHYSFTIALMSALVGVGAALGSMFATKFFKKISIFNLTILATIVALLTTISILLANIYAVLISYGLLAFVASATSIKLTQWLVTSVDHQILASTVGLLNTILMASAPAMTTILTTITGASNIQVALIVLSGTEIITLSLEFWVKTKSIQ